ncbi:RNA polymerase sigma factor [Nocardiopsis ansamitocini]|uniref:RNA polymerase sigma-70 region 2 domain-containing protein n=1 Tax=Nocardiopsis ansamitocini TaxID=1670832 RepID=A0A9W6UK51_9ACTN|nr:sigma-70 family RNA polymerase sigma factor [Nocardiopsis ansamitocini]GLU49203.1 hypothetical protein Nans01_35540 [Nocardiopsis ansamitocini]
MRDADIVHAIIVGGPDGLGEAYTRYADRLYDYSLRLLGEPEAATDALHDTFLIAREQIPRLRDPAMLRPWLYAITRSQCHRALGDRDRFPLVEEDSEPDTVSVRSVGRPESHASVRTALSGLDPRDREVVHLALRHRLDGPRLAAVLGIATRQADEVVRAASARLERALSPPALARIRDCRGLRALLADHDGAPTPPLRRRIVRHTAGCARCERRSAGLVAPEALVDAVPIATAPHYLRDQLMANAFDPELDGHHAEFAAQAGPLRADGFPAPARSEPRPRVPVRPLVMSPVLTLVTGALVVALVGWLVLPILADRIAPGSEVEVTTVVSLEPANPERSHYHLPQPSSSTRQLVPEPRETSERSPVGTPPRPVAGTPDEEPPIPPEESPDETPSQSPAMRVTSASGQDITPEGCVQTWTLQVSAGVDGEATRVALEVDTPYGGQRIPMTSTGGAWSAQAVGLPMDAPVTWTVVASGPGTASSANGPHTTSRASCSPDPTPTG